MGDIVPVPLGFSKRNRGHARDDNGHSDFKVPYGTPRETANKNLFTRKWG